MVNVDTKLLVIFVELLSKRNATYVAEKMHMTAPAVSHSLGRLREIFDDPLFIRVPHGLTPTPKALELGPKVREMLDLWAAINEGDIATFDPAEATGTFNVSFAGTLGDALFDRFLLRIKRLAPGLQVRLTESASWEADVAAMRAQRAGPGVLAVPHAPPGDHGRGRDLLQHVGLRTQGPPDPR